MFELGRVFLGANSQRAATLLAGLVLVLGACAGQNEIPRRGQVRYDAAALLPAEDASSSSWQDSALSSQDGESGADQGGSSVVGAACPCKAPLLCVLGGCRRRCAGGQACNTVGECGAGQTCAATEGGSVCLPGGAAGAACSDVKLCAGGALCISTSTTGYDGTCRATCTSSGASCPGGGTCKAIPGTSCLSCQP